VQITSDVRFYTHGGGHVTRQKYPNFDTFGKIKVEDGAYIGACSMIMAGVTIGEGALVAAGSIVTKSVPPRTVVAGNPARQICTVDEYIEKNLKYNLNTKGISAKEKRALLLSLPENSFIVK
jgi:acetyltransferase-like isoleucine patch superfamily enzyme